MFSRILQICDRLLLISGIILFLLFTQATFICPTATALLQDYHDVATNQTFNKTRPYKMCSIFTGNLSGCWAVGLSDCKQSDRIGLQLNKPGFSQKPGFYSLTPRNPISLRNSVSSLRPRNPVSPRNRVSNFAKRPNF